MSNPRTMELFERFLENSIDADGWRELRDIMHADAAIADDLRDHAAIHALVATKYGKLADCVVWESVSAALQGAAVGGAGSGAGRATPMTWIKWAIPLAAAAGIVAMAYLSMTGRQGDEQGAKAAVVATVQRVDGKAGVLMPDGGEILALAGESLRKDQTVRTEAGALVELRLVNGAMITLGEKTDLALLVGGEGNEALLKRGRLYCDWKKDVPSDRTLSILTAAGHRASVLGTRFELASDGVKTTIAVAEGEVLFSSAHDSRKVLAMQRVDAEGDSISPSKNISLSEIASWRPGAERAKDRHVWRFDKGMPEGFRLIYGQGHFEPKGATTGTRLVAEDLLCAPVNFTKSTMPFTVIVKGQIFNTVKPSKLIAVHASDTRIPAYKYWVKSGWHLRPGNLEFHSVFIGEKILNVLDDDVAVVRQHDDLSGYEGILVMLENCIVNEIEIRPLTAIEIERYKDIDAITRRLTPGPSAVRASVFAPTAPN
ncbi:MAG: hypothetical protein C0404_13265 [Verrucomicrobia bacterium]|nr:hypothetical protein [Verrucomicrobiota bacterium]